MRERAPVAPWIIAGLAVAALVVVLAAPRVAGPTDATSSPATADARAPTVQGTNTGPGEGATPPALSGSPREQADRLFNRVMSASAAGDSAEVSFFLPMAIEAYNRVDALDADGRYHLSVLYAAAGDAARARAAAERILDARPDHLLGLGAAARAAVLERDDAAARRFYRRLLDVYDTEMAMDRPVYREHARILPEYRDEARAYLADDGD
ncbi:MAG: hypothetical protein ACODAE_07140 [Gemmatimonadota bacterium]